MIPITHRIFTHCKIELSRAGRRLLPDPLVRKISDQTERCLLFSRISAQLMNFAVNPCQLA
jgi:hypothetical protein